MTSVRKLTVLSVTLLAFLLPFGSLFVGLAGAVPVNATDNASEEGQEKSNTRSDVAGWVQSGKVLNIQASDTDKSSTRMDTCLEREEAMNKKAELISNKAEIYEKKLTALLGQIIDLKEQYAIDSSEIDALITASNNVKKKQVDPILVSMTSYQQENKISCKQGVDKVIAQLIQIRGNTQELKEALSIYRNSIRAVLFAVRDASREGSS